MSGFVSVVFVYKSSLKMAAPLSNCNTLEQQTVISVLRLKGIKTSEVYGRMLAQYGEWSMAHKNLYKQVNIFKLWRTTLDDEE